MGREISTTHRDPDESVTNTFISKILPATFNTTPNIIKVIKTKVLGGI
jgi:hypothetical protein